MTETPHRPCITPDQPGRFLNLLVTAHAVSWGAKRTGFTELLPVLLILSINMFWIGRQINGAKKCDASSLERDSGRATVRSAVTKTDHRRSDDARPRVFEKGLHSATALARK